MPFRKTIGPPSGPPSAGSTSVTRLFLVALIATVAPAAAAAETVRRLPAPEARQGAAVGPRDLYAIANSRIARYDKRTGERRATWQGDPARFPHVNACAVIARDLACASSSFPAVPQWSRVEFFDPATLAHRRTVTLAAAPGSITWVDRHDGAWWAMFANYDGKGGEPGRDHRATRLVRYDDHWRPTGRWLLPRSILDRIVPMSISGGGWGPDGRLYLTGHDRPELYAVTVPAHGAVLDHVGTIPIEAAGQSIDWDERDPGMLYGIDRAGGRILQMRVLPRRR